MNSVIMEDYSIILRDLIKVDISLFEVYQTLSKLESEGKRATATYGACLNYLEKLLVLEEEKMAELPNEVDVNNFVIEKLSDMLNMKNTKDSAFFLGGTNGADMAVKRVFNKFYLRNMGLREVNPKKREDLAINYTVSVDIANMALSLLKQKLYDVTIHSSIKKDLDLQKYVLGYLLPSVETILRSNRFMIPDNIVLITDSVGKMIASSETAFSLKKNELCLAEMIAHENSIMAYDGNTPISVLIAEQSMLKSVMNVADEELRNQFCHKLASDMKSLNTNDVRYYMLYEALMMNDVRTTSTLSRTSK